MNINNSISLFYSYALNDAELRDELDTHLSSLRREGLITQWYDRYISAGTDRVDQTNQQLNTAHIILLLISPDFINSDRCYNIEMKRALERHGTGEARVIPVLLRPTDWKHTPFANLQVLPHNESPITEWTNRDLVFRDIVIELRAVITALQASGMNTTLNIDIQQNPLQILQIFSQFRDCQEKASELKTLHNMLHEIEVQLEGLSETVQQVTRSEREETNQLVPEFHYIEIMWQQTALKLDYLAYFAAKEMRTVEKERFSFDNDVIRGPSWITDLFLLQRAFDRGIKDQDRDTIQQLSRDLLTKCRTHLYNIDQRLLRALKDLDSVSDLIAKDRT